MNTNETTTTTTTTVVTKRPAWWTAEQEAAWTKAKAAIVADWSSLKHEASQLQAHVEDKALAFGHGARARFAEMGAWSDELEKKLAEDWKKTEEGASEGWTHVVGAVKHGWERAKASVKS